MLKESIGSGSIKSVVKQAESVATTIIGNVEKIIASKQADIEAAKRAYDELNKRLEQQVIQNQNLSGDHGIGHSYLNLHQICHLGRSRRGVPIIWVHSIGIIEF